MATQHDGSSPRRAALRALPVTFTVIGLLALALGYLGFRSWHSDYGHDPLDLLYYDLQLFVLGADPLQNHGPYPPILEVARFAAPAVTVYALAEALRMLFAAEMRRVRARRSRRHVVVCGETAIADAITRRLGEAGRRVVAIKSMPSPSAAGPLIVYGDARDPQVLRAANVAKADALYACAADSPANAAIALAASQVRPADGPPLKAYAYVRDAELCLTLQARYLGAAQPGAVRLDFFNTDELAARKLLATESLERADGRAPRVLVVGATPVGRAVLVEVARQWRLSHPGTTGTLPITLVDIRATAVVMELIQRYPFLRTVCRFTMYDRDLLRVLANGGLHRAPDRVYICHDREEHALKSALTAERFWRGASESVVVRLDQLAGIRSALGGGRHGFFGEVAPRLRIFGVIDTACEPELLGEDLIERLARAIHDRYRLQRLLEGDTPQTNTSTVAWERLAPERQESNREQARDIGRKLRQVGCALIPRVGADDPLDPGEVERLAQLEHERWYEWHVKDGWRYGEQRDEVRKLHPGTRTWDQLAPYLRQRDLEAVRNMPLVLADAGFQIVRV